VEIEVFAGVTFSDTCDIKDDKVIVPEDTDQVDYQTTDSRVNGVGDVTVNAVAKAPYFFAKDAVTVWKHTFTNEPCPVEITTFAAASASDVCGIDGDKLNVPEDTLEVDYQTTDNRVNGVGSAIVTATAKAPYFFAKDAVTSWTFEFTNELCPVTITTFAAASAKDVCGTAKDVLNVPADTLEVDYQTTDNRVNGVGTVGVKAVAKAPYVFPAGVQTSWTFTFSDEACKPTGGIDAGLVGFDPNGGFGGFTSDQIAMMTALLLLAAAAGGTAWGVTAAKRRKAREATSVV